MVKHSNSRVLHLHRKTSHAVLEYKSAKDFDSSRNLSPQRMSLAEVTKGDL